MIAHINSDTLNSHSSSDADDDPLLPVIPPMSDWFGLDAAVRCCSAEESMVTKDGITVTYGLVDTDLASTTSGARSRETEVDCTVCFPFLSGG